MSTKYPTPTKPNLPRSNWDLRYFGLNYQIHFNDAPYFQPAGTKSSIGLANNTFSSRFTENYYSIRTTPETIQKMNIAKTEMVALLRQSMRLNVINFKAGLVTARQLLILGQSVPKLTISPEPAPRYAPGLLLVSQTRSVATLRLIQTTNRGSNTNTRLPVGVQNVQLLQKTINNGLHLIRSFTRPVVRVPLEHFAPGSDIVIAARYLGVRSEPGPISQSLTIHIPASPVVPS